MSADIEPLDRALAKEAMFALIDKLEYYKKKLEIDPNITFAYREEFLFALQNLVVKHLINFSDGDWSVISRDR